MQLFDLSCSHDPTEDISRNVFELVVDAATRMLVSMADRNTARKVGIRRAGLLDAFRVVYRVPKTKHKRFSKSCQSLTLVKASTVQTEESKPADEPQPIQEAKPAADAQLEASTEEAKPADEPQPSPEDKEVADAIPEESVKESKPAECVVAGQRRRPKAIKKRP